MTRKARSHDVLGKLSAFSMAVVVLFSIFTPMLSGTMGVDAADASSTLDGNEMFTIHLDSAAADSWKDSMQVRFTGSSGNTLAIQSITAPAVGDSVTVTAPAAAAGATNIVVENLDTAKAAVKTRIDSLKTTATTAGKVLVLYDNSDTKWTTLKYYAYKDSGSSEEKWPGNAMTQITGSSIWYASVDKASYDKIIFNDGGSNQIPGKDQPGYEVPASTSSKYCFSSLTNSWIEYSAVINSVTLSVANRAGNDKNHLYLTGEKTAAWSKYNGAPTGLMTIYFKPTANWSQASVTYDEDDPYSTTVPMTKYTLNTENPDAPLIFTAQVPVGAKLTFADGTGSSVNHEVKNIYYNGDTSNNTYIQASTQWDTLEKALATASKNVDYTVTANNFSTETPSSGQKVVGVKATYFDYLSNNELTQGWRNGLVTDQHSDTNDYCLQFSMFNSKLKEVATGDNSWRYPLYFGNYYRDRKDALNAYYIGSRANNTETFFDAANNSNWLANNGGKPTEGSADYHRSVMGLVHKNLSGGNLMVTQNTQAPWFNNDLLKPPAESGGVSSTTNSGVPGSANGVYFSGSMNGWTTSDSAWELTSTDSNMYTGTFIIDASSANYTFKIYDDGKYYGFDYWFKSDATVATGISASNNQDMQIECIQQSGKIKLDVTYYKEYGGNTRLEITQSDAGSGSAQYAKIIDSYFPFVADTDSDGVTTYSFNSADPNNNSISKDNIYFTWQNGEPTAVNYSSDSNKAIKNKFSSGNYGIFPFNTANGNGGIKESGYDFGFGIKMEMDFTLPMNGQFENRKHATFDYSGDDDLWVFVDGKLVLDLGGNHEKTTGSIDFGAGTNLIKATSNSVSAELNTTTKETTVYEFVFDSTYDNFIVNNSAGSQYPGKNQGFKHQSDFNGKVFNTFDKSFTTLTGYSSGVKSDGKYHLYVYDNGNWGNIHLYQKENNLGNWPGTGNTNTYVVLEELSAISDVWKNGASVDKYISINNTDPTRKHTMSVFYMERGLNDSNLSVSYTIQPVQNDLTVNKEVSVPDINSGIASDVATAVANSDFGFTMSTKSGTAAEAAYANKGYAQTSSDGTKSSMTTNSTGGFTLKQNYSANFTKDLTYGDLINISESVPGIFSYNTYYTVKDNKTDTALKYSQSKDAAFNLINKIGTAPNGDPDSGASVTVNYTNTLQRTNLLLSKTLWQQNGTTPSTMRDGFTFEVLLDLDGTGGKFTDTAYNLEYQYVNAEGTVLDPTVYTAENGKINLSNGQRVKFLNIPVGAKYKIKEEAKSGFELYKVNGTETTNNVAEGTLSNTTDVSISYENKERPASSRLQAQKTLDGGLYQGTDFSFTAELIRRDNGATIDDDVLKAKYNGDGTSVTSTVDGTGYITFADFNVIPNTDNVGKYVFKLTEAATADASPYNYDSTVYYAVIVVTEGSVKTPVYYKDANLTSVVGTDGNTAPTFENTTKGVDVQFTKVGDNGNGLNGVEFKIYTDANCTQQYTTNGVGDAIGDNGTVTSTTVDTVNGVVKVEKMAYSTTAETKYYFKETKTLSGYQLLANPVVVTIATDGTYTVSYNDTELTDNKVTNNLQPELPIAGGVGVTMFYVLGALAVVIAGTAFVFYKKRINVIALAAHLIHRK